MIKKIFTFFLTIVPLVILFAQPWIFQNATFPGGTGNTNNITGIHVVDANTVWAYTDTLNPYGFYTRTSNGGTTWVSGNAEVSTNPEFNIRNISAANANVAWEMVNIANKGNVYKTINGGTAWTPQKQLLSWGYIVHFFDVNNGVAVGDPKAPATTTKYEIFTTQDGGTTWNQVSYSDIPLPNTVVTTNQFEFPTSYYTKGNTIFFLTRQIIHTTLNSDNTYNYVYKQRIYKSTDKGLVWTVLPNTFTDSYFSTGANTGLMAWSNQNKGIVFQLRYQDWQTLIPLSLNIYRTLDGGATWNNVSYTGISLPSHNISAVDYVPNTDILVATGKNGGSWKSIDNGSTWTVIDQGVKRFDVKCFDADNCYSGGTTIWPNVPGGMYKLSITALSTDEVKEQWEKLGVYPNPTKDELNIITERKIKSFTLTDMQGRKIKDLESSKKIDLSHFTNGLYILNIYFSDGTSSSVKVQKE